MQMVSLSWSLVLMDKVVTFHTIPESKTSRIFAVDLSNIGNILKTFDV